MGVAEAMGAALERTAHSVNIKERLDFSCALFDAGGGLVANAPHMPVHLGSMGASVRAVSARHPAARARRGLRAQQPLRRRHPPARHHRGHAGVRATASASRPSSSPPAATTPTSAACSRARCRRSRSTIDEEGVLLDALPIMRGGVFLEAETRAALSRRALAGPRAGPQHRRPEGADRRLPGRRGGRRGADRRARRGGGRPLHGLRAGQRRGRGPPRDRRADGRRGARPDGRRRRDRGHAPASTPAHGEAALDFTGSSAQLPSNFNAPASVVDAAALYVFRCLVDDDIPLNAGCLTPLKIIMPPKARC